MLKLVVDNTNPDFQEAPEPKTTTTTKVVVGALAGVFIAGLLVSKNRTEKDNPED